MESETLKEQDEQVETGLVGGLDSLELGKLFGWVADLSDPEPVDFAVYCAGKVIGKGTADLLRPDLIQSGIHDGKHGFSIDINSDLLVNNEPLELRLLESDKPVKTNDFKVHLSQHKYHVNIQRVEGCELYFDCTCNSAIGEVVLVFMCDGEVFASHTINSNEKSIQQLIYLPAKILDSASHLIEVGVRGYPAIVGGGQFHLETILTPWQYLKSSWRESGVLSHNRQASHHYESLHYQLEAIVNGTSAVTHKDLLTAHSVVCESFSGRKKFPKFSLPKFENPEVSIIIPAYNKFELTYHCIASILLAYNKTSYEVILADDCSTDETVNATDIIQNLVISKNPENLRFLRSCNRATDIASGEYIIFLNNDTEVTSYWIDELVAQHQKHSDVGLTGSKLLNLDGSL